MSSAASQTLFDLCRDARESIRTNSTLPLAWAVRCGADDAVEAAWRSYEASFSARASAINTLELFADADWAAFEAYYAHDTSTGIAVLVGPAQRGVRVHRSTRAACAGPLCLACAAALRALRPSLTFRDAVDAVERLRRERR